MICPSVSIQAWFGVFLPTSSVHYRVAALIHTFYICPVCFVPISVLHAWKEERPVCTRPELSPVVEGYGPSAQVSWVRKSCVGLSHTGVRDPKMLIENQETHPANRCHAGDNIKNLVLD